MISIFSRHNFVLKIDNEKLFRHFTTEIFVSNFTIQFLHLRYFQYISIIINYRKNRAPVWCLNLPWSSEIMRISFWKANSAPKLVINEHKVKVSRETKKRLRSRKTRSEARASLKMEAAVLSKVHYLRGRFLYKGVGWVTSLCLESSS